MCINGTSRRDFLRLFGGGAAATAAGLLLPPGISDLIGSDSVAAAAPRTMAVTGFDQRRVLDTRQGITAPNRRIDRNTIEIDTGTDADAVAITLTCIATQNMFAMPYPADVERPEPASLVNLPAGGTRANTTIVKAAAGRIRVFHLDPHAEVIVDLTAVLHTAGTAAAGRIVSVTPRRLSDTRETGDPLAAGEVAHIRRPKEVPGGAQAMLVNLTAVHSASRGHLIAYPDDMTTPPKVSNLNCERPGVTRGAFAIVPITGTGFNVFAAKMGCDLVVDVYGYITGPDAPESSAGLYVAVTPRRLYDSRGSNGQNPPQPARSTHEIGGINGGAAMVNVTSVGPQQPGHFIGYAAGQPSPTTSVLNYTPGDTIANSALLPISQRGIAVYQHATGHKVIDLYGWVTGTPVPAPLPPPVSLDLSEPFGIQHDFLEPYAAEWVDLGHSTDGRLMRAFRIGTGPKTAAVVTHIHGDEWTGESIVTELARQGGVAGWSLWLLPAASPDARAANTRYAHGVDLNRDFDVGWRRSEQPHSSGCIVSQTGPTPYSTHEARLLHQAFTNGPLAAASVVISHHDNYNWIAPQSGSGWNARQWANEYAQIAGLRLPGQGAGWPSSISYTNVDGGFETWLHAIGKQVFLVENKAGYGGNCTINSFGQQPASDAVLPHVHATRTLLSHY